MKLIRAIDAGKVVTGIAYDDKFYSTAGFGHDYNESFFETGKLQDLQKFIDESGKNLPELPANIKLLSPVARPSKIICIGLNYSDHALETKATPPAEPVIFLKSTTALAGPFDDVIMPRGSVKTDWEVELAIVIEKKASYVDEASAMDYVAGFCLHNDISEREFQLERSGTWDKGKGCDTFAPMGPYFVTKDEVSDVNNLRLWLTLNGRIMQDGNTSNMIFKTSFPYFLCKQFHDAASGGYYFHRYPCRCWAWDESTGIFERRGRYGIRY